MRESSRVLLLTCAAPAQSYDCFPTPPASVSPSPSCKVSDEGAGLSFSCHGTVLVQENGKCVLGSTLVVVCKICNVM